MAVDDQSEIHVSIPQETLPRQPILLAVSTHLSFSHTSEFRRYSPDGAVHDKNSARDSLGTG